MNRHFLFALAFIFVVLCASIAWKFLSPEIEQRNQLSTSDAKNIKAQVRIKCDDWIGYALFDSTHMKNQLRSNGYSFHVTDDKGDVDRRMLDLKEGKIDMAVFTVDAAILNGAKYGYPFVIVGATSKSYGGDAMMVSGNSSIKNIADLKKIGKDAVISFTSNSPSAHLVKCAAVHFDIPDLYKFKNGIKYLSTSSSKEARENLENGKSAISVVWEPDVTRLLSKGYKIIFDTRSIQDVVVDVIVVNRKYMSEHGDIVKSVLSTYFNTVTYFKSHEKEFEEAISKFANTDVDTARKEMKNVEWVDLETNARKWFGIHTPGSNTKAMSAIFDTIESAYNVQRIVGDFSSNPFPNGDYTSVVNSEFIKSLYGDAIKAGTISSGNSTIVDIGDTLRQPFSKLNDNEWGALRVVGSLKVEPVAFDVGTHKLTMSGKNAIDAAVNQLKFYPVYRIIIGGHTSDIGDVDTNVRLSQSRAEAVAKYLEVLGINPNRMKAIGYGSNMPPERLNSSETGQEEPFRTYKSRWPRVEITFVTPN